MKNNFLNAIQNGLNTLTIDDNDLSISYHTSDIDNNYNPALTLDQIHRIFKNNHEDIFKYNTIMHFSLILDDNTEISLNEYTPDKKPVFLKISNDELLKSGNEILIYAKGAHFISEDPIYWQSDYNKMCFEINTDNIIKAYDDFNGYENSIRLKNAYNKRPIKGIIPAVEYCLGRRTKIKNHMYQGYLPACGQLHILTQEREIINYILAKINEYIIMYTSYWSSSECSEREAWSMVYSKSRFEETYYGFPNTKLTKLLVWPFFKCID